ncbi:hypothetical protein PIB30_066658 [Stylosanthes scabra]|uniref:PGG domain-containing protein n=1 Tax=Stylosanthes scabra TaxID=79078 RepID=A0ABU6SN18_9FABA|nr:hypothetical protein [Stylosanthes scabra]
MANNVDPLKEAALTGDIERLYALIQENPNILRDVDEKPFVDTPLHIAASLDIRTNPDPGLEIKCFFFATEIMALKPSFALKLNPQGFSPLHLAIKNGHSKLASRLVEMNKELVRVKGREGNTPLHLVSQIGDCDLLVRFLLACPDSIEDVNSRDETALHVAVRYRQFDALVVLVGWLRRNTRMGADVLEGSILNWRDVANNTILHLSVINQDIQALDFLIKQGELYLDAKNSEKKTALDLAANEEDMKSKLSRAGARPVSSVGDNPPDTPLYIFRRPISVFEEIKIIIGRFRGAMSASQRDAYLVAAALILTAIYQSALSPPGGFYQADAINLNVTSSLLNSAAGKSVLATNKFTFLTFINTIALVFTIMALFILIPAGKIGLFLVAPTFYFGVSYLYSIELIKPPREVTGHQTAGQVTLLFFILFLGMFITFVMNVSGFFIKEKPKRFIRQLKMLFSKERSSNI